MLTVKCLQCNHRIGVHIDMSIGKLRKADHGSC
jgi:hypothetical protein